MRRFVFFFFFKQKTAYEMRISDWSSDVCSSDLRRHELERGRRRTGERDQCRLQGPPVVLAPVERAPFALQERSRHEADDRLVAVEGPPATPQEHDAQGDAGGD